MGIVIAIDAFRLVAEPRTSGAVYVAEMAKALSQQADVDRIYLLLSSKPDENFVYAEVLLYRGVVAVWPEGQINPASSGVNNTLWIQIHVPRLIARQASDTKVFIAPYHQTPIIIPRSVRVATVIHDFCGLRKSSGYHPLSRRFYSHLFNFITAWVRADRLIPISDYTRRDILRLMRVRAGRLTPYLLNSVTTQPIDADSICDLMVSRDLVTRGFFLAYGGGGVRKGVDLTLKSYDQYRREGGTMKLVLIGQPSNDMLPEARWIEKYERDIVVVTQITDHERDSLYKGAIALIFPSRCEGFGYPLVEAMRQGCPPIAWADTPASEIVGNAIPLIEKLNITSVVGMMKRIEMLSENEQKTMRQSLYFESKRFEAHDFGKRLLSCLN